MISVDTYLTLIVTAFCTGIGASLGAFLTNRVFIKHIEKIEKEAIVEREKTFVCPYLCQTKPPVEINEEEYEED